MRRNLVRFSLAAILLVSAVGLGVSYASAENTNNTAGEEELRTVSNGTGMTAISTFRGPLLIVDPEGEIRYELDNHDSYWDIDPLSGDRLLYSATDRLDASECPAETSCIRNVIGVANYSTGETETLFVRYRATLKDVEWHDVDRVGENRFLVADMAKNQVYIVNVSTGIVDWMWTAQSTFNISSGGSAAFGTSYPEDWTHVNDVETVRDDWIMVSPRNQDQVLFIDKRTGVVQNWTLGAENDHETLYEQHNPDFIPASDGGPSVLVADSHNNRVVEYQRVDGEWVQVWEWSDSEMVWPRDADRLPNGHTVITDSNTNRVLEVNEAGEVVWEYNVSRGKAYEAERIGTGDESSGGPAANKAGLVSRNETTQSNESGGFNPGLELWLLIKDVLPNKILSSLLFVVPNWLGIKQLPWLVGFAGSGGLWLGLEVRWRYVD